MWGYFVGLFKYLDANWNPPKKDLFLKCETEALTLASKVREAPRLLGFSCNPRTSSKSQKKPFPILLCPLSETHSALDLDPPSYLPVPTLLRGMCEARLGGRGSAGRMRVNRAPHPVLDSAFDEAPMGELQVLGTAAGDRRQRPCSCRAYSLARGSR